MSSCERCHYGKRTSSLFGMLFRVRKNSWSCGLIEKVRDPAVAQILSDLLMAMSAKGKCPSRTDFPGVGQADAYLAQDLDGADIAASAFRGVIVDVPTMETEKK